MSYCDIAKFLLLASKTLKESEMQSESEVEESENTTSDEEGDEDEKYIHRVCRNPRTLKQSAKTGFEDLRSFKTEVEGQCEFKIPLQFFLKLYIF